MTNFEKWKAIATADEIYEMVWRLRCHFCPKMKLLKPGPNFCNSLQCREEFMKWASEEAKEDEE